MGLSTFFGILTLQVGVTVLAAVFLTLGAVILVANILEGSGDGGVGGGEEEKGLNYPFLIIFAFGIGLIIVGALAFLSAYSESRCLAMLALLVLIVLVVLWVMLCVLSFIGKKETVETVCRGLRCPESLWLANLDYRKEDGGGRKKREVKEIAEYLINPKETLQTSSIRPTNEIQQILVQLEMLSSCLQCCYKAKYTKNIADEANSDFNLDVLSSAADNKRLKRGLIASVNTSHSNLKNKTEQTGEKQKQSKAMGRGEGESMYKGGIPMYAAIALFIANLIFFLLAALVLYSWAQELGEGCYFEEPVYVVPQYYYY